MPSIVDGIKPTRDVMIREIAKITRRKGVMPEYAEMGLGTWVKMAETFTPSERRMDRDNDRQHVNVAGVPFYADPNLKEGSVFFFHLTEPKARGQLDGLEYLEI